MFVKYQNWIGSTLWSQRRPVVSSKSILEHTTSAKANTTSVGAAHLVGRKGIESGFPLTPCSSDINRKGV